VDRLGLDEVAPDRVDIAAPEVRAVVDGAGEGDGLGPREIAEGDDVEEPIGGVRVRRDAHAAAEIAAEGDGDVEHRALEEDLAVDLHADGLVAVLEQGPQRPQEEGGLAAEPLGGLVDEPVGDAAEPEARDVDEGPDDGALVLVDGLQDAEIDGASGALEGHVERLVQVAAEAEGAAVVAARTGGDDRDLGARHRAPLGVDEGLGDLVEGAVTAEHGEQADPIPGRGAGQVRGLARARGLDDFVGNGQAPEPIAQGAQLAQRSPGSGPGVEQHADVRSGHEGFRSGVRGSRRRPRRAGIVACAPGRTLDGPTSPRIVVPGARA
jgi:hypothetical protein